LLAVYLRGGGSGWADRVIYIGPMGCRTGLYLIVKGEVEPEEILPVLQDAFAFVQGFEGAVPATTSKECGNYLDHDLGLAQKYAKRYLTEVLRQMRPENMIYPA